MSCFGLDGRTVRLVRKKVTFKIRTCRIRKPCICHGVSTTRPALGNYVKQKSRVPRPEMFVSSHDELLLHSVLCTCDDTRVEISVGKF